MRINQWARILGIVILTLLLNWLVGHLSTSVSASDSPTIDEFNKLKSDVDRIRLDEETNLASINSVDNKYKQITDKANSDFKAAEFKLASVGDIVASSLTLEQFRIERGDKDGSQWVQCDGREYPDSAYAKYAKEAKRTPAVPDLRGRYPRGLTDGFSLLETLEDQLQDHVHYLDPGDKWGIQPDGGDGNTNSVARTGYAGTIKTTGVQKDKDARFGKETRPKTTIVNFFVRIN
jgi:hypothetical protein